MSEIKDEKIFYKKGDDYFDEAKEVASKILSNEEIKKSIQSYISNFKKLANLIISSFNSFEERKQIEASIMFKIGSEFNILLEDEQVKIIQKELKKIQKIKKEIKLESKENKKKSFPKINIKDDISLC